MARNKSEKLPSCPEAYAYMAVVEKWLSAGTPVDVNDTRGVGAAWHQVPPGLKTILLTNPACPFASNDLGVWRKSAVKYIREHYAA